MRGKGVRSIAVCAACVLVLVACGDDDGATGSDAGTDAGVDGGPVTNDDAGSPDSGGPDAGLDTDALLARMRARWCGTRANLTCDSAYDCACDRGERPDLATCLTTETQRCYASMVQPLREHLESGRVTVDLPALDACEARLRDTIGAACSGRVDDVAEWCARFLIDDVAEGEECASQLVRCLDGEGTCATGTCERAPALGEACTFACRGDLVCRGGTCAELSDVGETCEADSHCAGTAFCVDGTCAASRVAIGAACDETSECVGGARCEDGECVMADPTANCEDDTTCGALTTCEPYSAQQCVARGSVAIGGACLVDEQCAPGAYCEGYSTCAARVATGEGCDRAAMCADGYCDIGSPTPTCLAPAAEGEGCDAPIGHLGQVCADGLVCVASTCRPPPPEGQPCGDQNECATGLVCGAGNRCRTPIALGAACDVTAPQSPCVAGAFCDEGTCAAARPASASCDGLPGECGTGLACLDIGTPHTYVCTPLPGAGELCAIECVSDSLCVFGPIGGRCQNPVCNAIPAPPPPF
ncbi:Dickkopf N-terminal cysteine-rich domain-containing protein [Sandaracinus amylolyticus]|uniref:Dickkopf N-terminal cysteine-rich domain-containing protein n=1 Tax=Sandaracinus amylolyticus TaxID=927083 RepID=UPI001F1A4D04|nr:Dickkopf N-terminal cysteine-rich domain-containing protein [Sandaracinus amylolyticus]UJR83369.1 Hypothetical protein I5071_54370 [Sandaracinus amylolyticus]